MVEPGQLPARKLLPVERLVLEMMKRFSHRNQQYSVLGTITGLEVERAHFLEPEPSSSLRVSSPGPQKLSMSLLRAWTTNVVFTLILNRNSQNWAFEPRQKPSH